MTCQIYSMTNKLTLLEDLIFESDDDVKVLSSGTIVRVFNEMKITDNLDALVYKQIDEYKKGNIDYTECEKNITDLVNKKLHAGGDRYELEERYKEYLFQLESI